MTAATKSKTTRPEAGDAFEQMLREIVAQGNARVAALEKIVAQVNEVLDTSDKGLDHAATMLFAAAWGADHSTALDPYAKASRAMKFLIESADSGLLKMDTSALRKAVRIGALNKKLAGSAWSSLGYSLKVELLPLVTDASELGLLQQGAQFAVQPGTSVRAIREWVAQRTANNDAEPGGMITPTAAVSAKVLAVGNQLGSGSQRDAWVTRVMRLPPAERRQHLQQLKAATQNFDTLAKSLEATLAALSS